MSAAWSLKGSKELRFAVDVTLISGQRVSLEADLAASVHSLAERARRELGVGRGRLFSSYGSVLDGDAKLGEAKLQTGDCLTLQVGALRICSGNLCFAAILGDGSVVTWGSARCGGDSSSATEQLKNVQHIQASDAAFAAILADGSVFTWGSADCGGDSSSVQDQLKNVRQIQATDQAFAAILTDGSVVTWGCALYGGDSSSVEEQLKNVQHIQASDAAFAAILADGSVVTWGSANVGGDSSSVQDQLKSATDPSLR